MPRGSSSDSDSGPVLVLVPAELGVADVVEKRGIGRGRIAFVEAEIVALDFAPEAEVVGGAVGSIAVAADTSPVAAVVGYEATSPDFANVADCTPEQSLAGFRSVSAPVQGVADHDAWSVWRRSSYVQVRAWTSVHLAQLAFEVV